MDDATTPTGRHSSGEPDGDGPDGGGPELEEVTDALPGSGQLDQSDDDLDGASGPIQVP